MQGTRVRRALAGRDLAVGYAVVVLVIAVAISALPAAHGHQLVLDSSTNLANLRQRPLFVLGLSAFVVATPAGLWVLAPLVVAYGAAQRWVGRLATLVVAVFGHVGATLFVAVLLATGIAHHQLDRSIAQQPDVGVSYGVAAVLGVLTARRPEHRLRWVLAGTLLLVARLAVSDTFTDLGHLTAWTIGVAIGLVVTAAGNAEDRSRGSVALPACAPAEPAADLPADLPADTAAQRPR
jgi:hypothetical protein